MKKIVDFYKKLEWPFWFTVGALTAFFSLLSYFVIGTDSYIQFHDQLDGEVLNYLYGAKYLGEGFSVVPEFMNGMHVSAMTVPSPIGVLFYKLLSPFHAFVGMHVYSVMIGYVGFFVLLRKLTNNPIISFFVPSLFVYLPFLPVYGLSILGQPLLIWAMMEIYDKEEVKLRHYLCIILYAISSSFVLVGYVWVFLSWLLVGLAWKKKKHVKRVAIAAGTLSISYVLCNLDLVKTFLGIGGANYVAHREEMVVTGVSDIKGYFGELFLEGAYCAQSYNFLIFIGVILTIIIYLLINKCTSRKIYSNSFKYLLFLLAGNVVIVLLATFWQVPKVAEIRMVLGGVLRYFQADRITWILPTSWYLILALSLHIIWNEWKGYTKIRYIIPVMVMIMLCNTVYKNSNIYHNLRLMIFPETYKLMGWDDYYAVDVYKQVEDYIGKDKATYRTLSLGITPAAALYNGFYCLDGYSNMYSLDYKHQFRKIIEKELEKSEEVKSYFDDWGNRCYLLNAETGNYMLIGKENTGSYQQLELNTNQMLAMGAKYLFAAMPIDNAEEMGLVLMREEPFSTQDSYFEVWLYEIYSVQE